LNNTSADKFNYLVLIFAVSVIISVFSKFTDALGIQSALFFILGASLFFCINAFSAQFKLYVLPLLFFILIAVISYYFADFKYNARNGIMLLSYSGAAYFLTFFLKPYDKRSVLLIPVLVGLWLTIFLFAANITFSGLDAPGALSKNARVTAGFLLLALNLSFVFWWTERKIYTYTSFILLAAIVLTKSYFALALACLSFGVFLYFMKEKVKLKPAVAVLPFLLAAATSFFKAFKSGYFTPKFESWQVAFSVIKDNFIIGTGFGNYQTVSGSYAKTAGFDVSQPDNLFLQLLAETGILGFFLFSAVLAVFFIMIVKKLKNKENKVMYLPVILAVIFFTAYNMFESSAFISTNMLVFFIILAFPLEVAGIKVRKRRIGIYAAVLLTLPVLYVLALPLLAIEDYKKGIIYFAANKQTTARDYYHSAMIKDTLNPAYASKIADTYFAMSQKEDKILNLDKAIEYKKFASSLNKYDGKYYYDLAWFYKQKGERELASENILKALKMDPFNAQFLESYGELVY